MSDEIIVHVLASTWPLPGRVHVQMAFDIWGKPGIAEAIGKAIQMTFDKPGTYGDMQDFGETTRSVEHTIPHGEYGTCSSCEKTQDVTEGDKK